MAWIFTESEVVPQAISETSTTQNMPLGAIRRAKDSDYGSGEFIYLKGVASTVVGSLVTYNALSGVTALAPNTANLGQPVAAAMSANIANQYGWYQICGTAVFKKTAVQVDPNVAMFLSTTVGRITDVVSAGKQVIGARSANAATVTTTVSTLEVTINRPHLQGQIT